MELLGGIAGVDNVAVPARQPHRLWWGNKIAKSVKMTRMKKPLPHKITGLRPLIDRYN